MPFLPPNQQRQSTEGIGMLLDHKQKIFLAQQLSPVPRLFKRKMFTIIPFKNIKKIVKLSQQNK